MFAVTLPVRFGLGSPLGSGNQIIPWIEIHDLAGIFLFLVNNFKSGNIINAVAPATDTNSEMMRKLAKAMTKPFFMPNVPMWILELVLGEMAEMVTTGNRISAEKIQQMGYQFKYKSLDEVFGDYYGR